MGRKPRIHREQILGAARDAFTTAGFDGTTLSDIATRLSVTPAAILRHFDSKQDLFHAAMNEGAEIAPPQCILDLATTDPATDPRVVLRKVAEGFIPFAQAVISTRIAVSMHERSRETSLVVPFDPESDDSPPRRGMRIVTDYFARAIKAGVIEAQDPRGAALLFMGSLQAYVLVHHLFNFRPVYPRDVYIETLLDVWTRGAIRVPKRGGTGGRTKETKSPQVHRAGDRPRGRSDRGGGLPARKEKTARARAGRNFGGEDGERRVARGRTRQRRQR